MLGLNKLIYNYTYYILVAYILGFPGDSEGKVSACNVGNQGSIPGSGRAPGEGNGNPLQYFCLGNPMDREAWGATVYGVAKSQTQFSDCTTTTKWEYRKE